MAGLRVFVRHMKGLPLAFFPGQARTITALFRAAGSCAQHQDAMHEVLAEAVATRDLVAAEELVAALRLRLREHAQREP